MSGLSEIVQWVISEIDLEVFDTAESAFEVISATFEADGRLDLDSILLDDKDDFMAFLEDKIEPKDEDEDEEDEEAPDIIEAIRQGLIALFG